MDLQLDENGLPVLEQFSEEGFIDCVLKIQNLKIDNDYLNFHMSASFNHQIVGADVKVMKDIQAGLNEKMELIQDHVYHEGVLFFRSGPESDRLISAIAHLYESESRILKMTDAQAFTAIALNQGDIDIVSEPVKLKLFGNDLESDEDDLYCECFLNIDIPNGLVYWNEKDPDYRQPILDSLGVKEI